MIRYRAESGPNATGGCSRRAAAVATQKQSKMELN
jgi:hypothetical protein